MLTRVCLGVFLRCVRTGDRARLGLGLGQEIGLEVGLKQGLGLCLLGLPKQLIVYWSGLKV